jgi:hypothetical protein
MILNEIHKKCEENFVFGIKAIFSEVQRKINIQNNEANYNDDDTIKKKIEILLIQPLFQYLIELLMPYLIILCVVFVLLILMIVSILYLLIFQEKGV